MIRTLDKLQFHLLPIRDWNAIDKQFQQADQNIAISLTPY